MVREGMNHGIGKCDFSVAVNCEGGAIVCNGTRAMVHFV